MSFKKAINQTAYTPEFKCSCTYTISSLSKERSCCDFAAALSRCGAGGQDTSLGSDLWSMSGRPRAGNKDVLSGPQCRSQTNKKKPNFSLWPITSHCLEADTNSFCCPHGHRSALCDTGMQVCWREGWAWHSSTGPQHWGWAHIISAAFL